jgi:hypothetical protein
VTDASVTEPSPYLSDPYLTNPTTTPKPLEPDVVVAEVEAPHKLTLGWTVPDGDWGSVSALPIPDGCQRVLIRWYVNHHLDGDSRTPTEWRRSFRLWATRAWNERRSECLAESKAKPLAASGAEPDWREAMAERNRRQEEADARIKAEIRERNEREKATRVEEARREPAPTAPAKPKFVMPDAAELRARAEAQIAQLKAAEGAA